MTNWKKAFLAPETPIKEAVQVIQSSGKMIGLIVNSEGVLLGTVTDGDIRRAILKDVSFDQPVRTIMNPNPKTGTEEMSEEELAVYMKDLNFRHLPIVNKKKVVVGLRMIDEFFHKELMRSPVLILAGGLGSRLGTLTEDCPKPMLKLKDKPLLEILVEHLRSHGFKKLYISVRYLSHQIEDHFGDGSRFGVNITYLKETTPLGTAGPLSLLPPEMKEPVLVINGDILTSLNFSDLFHFHQMNHQDLTACVRKLEFTLPYGVFELEGTAAVKIIEKPSIRKFINAGIYIINPSIFKLVEKDKVTGMNELINQAISKGLGVECFMIREYWKDIGTPEEFQQAQEDLQKIFLLTAN